MATTPSRGAGTKQLMKQIGFGMKNTPMGSGGMGALMGFMGLPFLSKGAGAGKGSGGGPFMTVDPRTLSMWQGGFGNRPPGSNTTGEPTTGGEDPAYDPNNPNSPLPGDKYKLNMIPEWWKDWYRTQGQYGGVPPVDGLL